MRITNSDVLWNYGASILRIASSALLLPLILRVMPSAMIGIWSIFMTITAFASMLDFGFNPSFTRNVTYIFSGVRSLKMKGHEIVDGNLTTVDYGLLKGLISAMRWFYGRMALVVLAFLAVVGTIYIHRVVIGYKGDHFQVYLAWALLCLINSYNLYTLYYDCLLEGRGLIKRARQIIIIGQSIYLIIASIFILKGLGLVAIVSAQAASVIIVRYLSFHSFFDSEIKLALAEASPSHKKEILRAIYPNAIKIGLTSFGGFMITRSAIIVGSLYLNLNEIATYGITMQVIGVVTALAGIYIATYQPEIVRLRVKRQHQDIKRLYLRGWLALLFTFILGGAGILVCVPWILSLIGSKTQLMPFEITALAVFVALEQTNLSMAANILLTKNEVPFFKASLISGSIIVISLYAGLRIMHLGLLGMVIIPLIIDLAYQAWKWPLEVIKDLKLTVVDITGPIIKRLSYATIYKVQSKQKGT